MRRIIAASLLLLLAACQNAPPPAPPPQQLNYSSLGQIGLNVAQVNVVSSADQSIPLPNVMRPTLDEAVRQWVHDRLMAGGNRGYASVVIQKADVKREMLPRDKSMEKMFTRQQAEKWTGTVEVSINVVIPDDGYSGFASGSASRFVTLPEDVTPLERSNAWNRILNGMMSDLNAQLQNNIQAHLGTVLR